MDEQQHMNTCMYKNAWKLKSWFLLVRSMAHKIHKKNYNNQREWNVDILDLWIRYKLWVSFNECMHQ